jgi:hypothetical protein
MGEGIKREMVSAVESCIGIIFGSCLLRDLPLSLRCIHSGGFHHQLPSYAPVGAKKVSAPFALGYRGSFFFEEKSSKYLAL